MEHRKNNRDGYKKIFPMSLFEDATFCHYCGRTVSPDLALQWDHVPALNVRIPEEYGVEFAIRKTLVRSCSECNNLASDTPHLDYLERHIWLKASYLRRYKTVLINANPDDKDELVSVTGKKSSLGFQELLNMLGFGLKSEELINSPILKIKNKPSGRLVESLIAEHLTGSPHEIDEEDKDEPIYDPPQNEEIKKQQLTTVFLRDFLLDEWIAGNKISSADMLRAWITSHPGRAFGLELRLEDVALVEGIFNNILAQVEKLYLSEVKSETSSATIDNDATENNDVIERKSFDTPATSSKQFKKPDARSEYKIKAYLKKHKNDIIMAFMMAVEGKRYVNGVINADTTGLLKEEEFLVFIRNSGLDRDAFFYFMEDKSFKAYNVHFPKNPEHFYDSVSNIW
jgi:hypothetical protein